MTTLISFLKKKDPRIITETNIEQSDHDEDHDEDHNEEKDEEKDEETEKKERQHAAQMRYRAKNKEAIAEKARIYYQKNKAKLTAYNRNYHKSYYRKNKEKINNLNN